MRRRFVSRVAVSGWLLATSYGAMAQGGWVEHPVPDGVCGRGSAYSYFVYPGDSDKVVIDFMGGGACWNERNCSTDEATFVDSVEYLRERQRNGLPGVYDKERANNPFAGFTHVVIPYCTGDLHWGSNTATYVSNDGDEFTIEHHGARNVQLVLDDLTDQRLDPTNILVTGCSAGSYGSIFWTPAIARTFPQSSVNQFGDSGAGVMTSDFPAIAYRQWQLHRAAPTWVPGLAGDAKPWDAMTLNFVYQKIGAYYSNIQLAQLNFAQDNVQRAFFMFMGGNPLTWSRAMRKSMADLTSTTENFKSFIYNGGKHCILPNDDIYDSDFDELRQWLRSQV